MCTRTLVDANLLPSINKPKLKPFIDWVTERHGVIVYTEEQASNYSVELEKVKKANKQIIAWNRAGIARRISADELAIGRKQSPVNQKHMKSNDLHVLELAAAGNVRLLCTEDQALQNDFRNREVLPGVTGHPARSIYPVNEPEKKQKKFLDQRKCRRK